MIGARGLLALPAALLAAACGGGSVTVGQKLGHGDAALARAVSGGVQPIEIHGAPPDGAAPEAVAAALPTPGFQRATTFRAAAPGEATVRIVIEFGRSHGGAQSCVAPGGVDGGAGLVAAATLCRGDTAFADAVLRAPQIAGPSDPAFGPAMGNLLSVLLRPEQRPWLEKGD